MGALTFYQKDIYGTGYMDSRMTTVPEASDQMALVDDEESAIEHQVHTDPSTSKGIIFGLIAVAVIIIVFSISK